jgi:hypothetical protein
MEVKGQLHASTALAPIYNRNPINQPAAGKKYMRRIIQLRYLGYYVTRRFVIYKGSSLIVGMVRSRSYDELAM